VNDNLPDPGLEPHQWRPTDVDPKAEKRAERQVAGLFGLAIVGSVLFVVSYIVFQVGDSTDTIDNLGASNLALGLTLALVLLAMGAGMIQWARKLMGDQEIVEMRHPAASSQEDREAAVAILQTGLEESGLGRRPLIRNSLLAAGGVLGILPIVMLRDLGPLPGDKLDHTIWDMGRSGGGPRTARTSVSSATSSVRRSSSPSSRSATWSTPSRRSSSPPMRTASPSSRGPTCWWPSPRRP
jgi:ubiquinol-cytochrome c reductase iron-sulfur subunit